jgi:hypothetical protein
LNDIFGMWRRRSALCLCGIGAVRTKEREEHPTIIHTIEVHQRLSVLYVRDQVLVESATKCSC